MTLSYKLIVNTNCYAGNFEREYCAFVTGALGECEVGEKQADAYREWLGENVDLFEEDVVTQSQDDRGCWRPVAIYNDEGVDEEFYHSLEIGLEEPLSDDQIKVIQERSRMFMEENPTIEIRKFRVESEEIVVTRTPVARFGL